MGSPPLAGMSLQPSYATNRWSSSPFAVGMCAKQYRCSVFERPSQHPQQIDSKPSCAVGLEKLSGREPAANEFDYAELVIPRERIVRTCAPYPLLDQIGLRNCSGPHMSDCRYASRAVNPCPQYLRLRTC